MKRAIVLSGGGGKGAYQIGFWKAIRELNVKYDIVTGTSIGALNGVFMVQGDYYNAFKLWYFMNYDKVFLTDINPKKKREVILNYVKGIGRGGLDVPGLENIIDTYLKPDLFYSSKVDYGLVTVKFPSLKPVVLTKNKIKKEDLKKYLLASSACFPAFKMKEINNEKYIDGGYYDNMPIDLAVKMGADEIICVNLKAPGIIKKNKNKDIPIIKISPRNNIGNFLVLEKNQARRDMKLGYNDTMKVFKILDGDFYTFKRGSLMRNFARLNRRFYDNLNYYVNTYNSILKNKKLFKKDVVIFNKTLENLMKAFLIRDDVIYRTSYVNVLLKKLYKNEKKTSLKNKRKIVNVSDINKSFISKELICFVYKEIENKDKFNKKLNKLLLLFPDCLLCAIYLKTIME